MPWVQSRGGHTERTSFFPGVQAVPYRGSRPNYALIFAEKNWEQSQGGKNTVRKNTPYYYTHTPPLDGLESWHTLRKRFTIFFSEVSRLEDLPYLHPTKLVFRKLNKKKRATR